MNFIENLQRARTIVKINGVVLDTRNSYRCLLFVHEASKHFCLVHTANPESYLRNFRANCRGLEKSENSYAFTQFYLTTKFDEWAIYRVLSPLELRTEFKKEGFKELTRLKKHAYSNEATVNYVLMKISAKGANIARWMVRNNDLSDSGVVAVVMASMQTTAHSTVAKKRLLALCPTYQEERALFMEATEYTVERFPDSPLLIGLRAAQYQSLVRRLNLSEFTKVKNGQEETKSPR